MNITDPIFHDEAKAEAHIFNSRWPDGEPICPHCGSTNCMVMGGKTQAGYWLCRDCRAAGDGGAGTGGDAGAEAAR